MSLADETESGICLFPDLKHETLLNIVHTANQVLLVADALFRQFDLTQAQFNVLFALKYKRIDVTQSSWANGSWLRVRRLRRSWTSLKRRSRHPRGRAGQPSDLSRIIDRARP